MRWEFTLSRAFFPLFPSALCAFMGDHLLTIRSLEALHKSQHFTVCSKFVEVHSELTLLHRHDPGGICFRTNKIVLEAGKVLERLDDRPDVRQISHTSQANKNVGMCELALWPLV